MENDELISKHWSKKIINVFPDQGKKSSFLSGSHDQTVLLWQWDESKNEVYCVHCCRGHAASVDCVAVNQSKDKVTRRIVWEESLIVDFKVLFKFVKRFSSLLLMNLKKSFIITVVSIS